MKENPCKPDCPRRSADCHCICKDYAEFAEDRRKFLEERRKERLVKDYVVKSYQRTRRK